LRCYAATYHFRDIYGQMAQIQAQNFGFWGPPRGTAHKRAEDLSATDTYIVQHFTLIVAKIAIAVTGQRKTANLVPCRTYGG